MKKSPIPALLLGFLLFASSQLAAQTPTEEALKKVCIAETQAWLDNNLDAWAATHTQGENAVLVWNNPDGSIGNMVGWTAIAATVKEAAAKGTKSTSKLVDENFRFTIQGNMAFVLYDQTLTGADGKTSHSREHRVLLLQGGQWKIEAVMAFYDVSKK